MYLDIIFLHEFLLKSLAVKIVFCQVFVYMGRELFVCGESTRSIKAKRLYLDLLEKLISYVHVPYILISRFF